MAAIRERGNWKLRALDRYVSIPLAPVQVETMLMLDGLRRMPGDRPLARWDDT